MEPGKKIRIGVLTSSRADFGIYLPLLNQLKKDIDFDLELIVFGTHLSHSFGYTIDYIKNQGFDTKYCINGMLQADTPNAISSAYGLIGIKFAEFWMNFAHKFDYVFALGDRYEMAAAVAAAIPFNIRIVHFHGGETTLGAIDNIYRHSISLASSMHFVSTNQFKKRLIELLGENKNIYVIGALSLENLFQLEILTTKQFEKIWGINLNIPTILITVHPETVNSSENVLHCIQLKIALEKLAELYQLVITLPNADTDGSIYREMFSVLSEKKDNVYLIENFGTQSYFSCMNWSKLLIGNTSSGIIEAASFNKFVLNLGDRQKGRLAGENVVDIPFDSGIIYSKAKEFSNQKYKGKNLYFQSDATTKVIAALKQNFNESF